VQGDSLRHLDWRASVRRGKLQVKEFEKTVNAEISIILDMSGKGHAGRGSLSTWTRAKDAALSLLAQKKPIEGAAGDTVFGKDREAQKPFFWLWINRGTIQEFDPDGPPPVPPAAPPSTTPADPKAKKT
jgi:hypothetical protein